MVSAGVAVLGVQRLVAGAAVRAALPHDVALATQRSLTLETTEVLHVPVPSLGLRALVCQNNLGLRRHQEERQRVSDALVGAKVESKWRLAVADEPGFGSTRFSQKKKQMLSVRG